MVRAHTCDRWTKCVAKSALQDQPTPSPVPSSSLMPKLDADDFPPSFKNAPQSFTTRVQTGPRVSCAGGDCINIAAGCVVYGTSGCDSVCRRWSIAMAVPIMLVLALSLGFSWQTQSNTQENAFATLTLIELMLSTLLIVVIFAALPFVSNEWLQQCHTKQTGSVSLPFQRRWWSSRLVRRVCGEKSTCATTCCVARVPRWAIPGMFAVEQWLVESAQIHQLSHQRVGAAGTTTGGAHEWGGAQGGQTPATGAHELANAVSVASPLQLESDMPSAGAAGGGGGPRKLGTLHGHTEMLEASGIPIVQFEWVWPVVAVALVCNTLLLMVLQVVGSLRYLATLEQVDGLEVAYIAYVLLYTVSAVQACAVPFMWAAACLYVARQAQAMKLLMLDTRLPVVERCERVTDSTARLVSVIRTWSWSLGTIILGMALCDVLFALTYIVALALPADEVGIGISSQSQVRIGQAGTVLLFTLHLLCILVPPIVANAEIASLPAVARCLLPGMHRWWWQPGSYAALWGRSAQDSSTPSQEGERDSHLVEMKVQHLREHLREMTSAASMESLNVSLGGVVVTGPLVAQALTLTYSAYYALLTYLTSIGHL